MNEPQRQDPTLDTPRPPGGVAPSSYSGPAPVGTEDVTMVSGSGSGLTRERAHVPTERPLIDGYELLSETHRGGQGVVYRATQLSTKRTVALKVLLDGPFAGDVARRRFEREVELAASLRHPNIVRILESGISQGRYYFAMEYIDGRPLDVFLSETKPSLRETLGLLEQVCQAVNFAHQRGVIHRDLKPSNILVDGEGSVQVLDFGLAKSHTAPDARGTTVRALSTPGQIMGTLAYMSPEQAAGLEEVDVRSDVYSLGVIAYEALLGRPPYSVVGTLAEILQRIAQDDPTPPRSARDSSRFGRLLDDEVGTILLKALEKSPSRRYQSAGELGADLRRYLQGEPIEAKRASGFYVLRKMLRRYRLQALAGGLLLSMLVAFLLVFAILYRSEKFARDEADELRRIATERARVADESAAAALAAREREAAARQDAERSARNASIAAAQRTEALQQQKLRGGDVAQLRGDLAGARDNYWDAYGDDPRDAAAAWSLRQYYANSGDRGARLLFYDRQGPVSLSPSGQYAAVCESADAVAVRGTTGGELAAWIPLPGPAVTLDVDDTGRLAAAGDRWLLVSQPDAPHAPRLVEWAGGERMVSCHIADEGRFALIVLGEHVRSVRTADGSVVAEVELSGELTGAPRYSLETRSLAAPTRTGAEVITMSPDGSLTSERVWSSPTGVPARAVQFAGDELLAVLADALYVSVLSGSQRGAWAKVVDDTAAWDAFDLRRGVGQIVLGAADGRVGVVSAGMLRDEWRITEGRLEQLRLAADGETLVTLDDRGSLTRWDPASRRSPPRRIHSAPPRHWEVSADGSAMLFIDRDGQVMTYVAEGGQVATPILMPSLVELVTGRNPEAMRVALAGDGRSAVIFHDNRLWFYSEGRAQANPIRWRDPVAPLVRELAFSGDGSLLALYAQSERGDVQRIHTFEIERGRLGRRLLRPRRDSIDFAGSTLRAMAFIPHTRTLLVARSNGTLLTADLEESASSQSSSNLRELSTPLIQLDAPAYRMSIDPAGHALAVACDDSVVRVISIIDGSELGRVRMRGTVGSLAFNSVGDVLMARTLDGELSLLPLESLEPILLRAPGREAQAFAAWLGPDDAILLADDAGVAEVRYHETDRLIEANRTYARQRRIARAVTDGQFDRAWSAAIALEELNHDAALSAQVSVLELLLRRPHGGIDPAWVAHVSQDAPPVLTRRLAHAAHTGGRFDLSRSLLAAAAESDGGAAPSLDAATLLCVAECEYLLGDPLRAAEQFAQLESRTDLLESQRARIGLQRVAALRMGGRLPEARRALEQMQQRIASSWPRDPIASLSAVSVGSYLLDSAREAQLAESFERLLTIFREQWLNYRDDSEFFAGELARQRGDAAEARLRYQKCIDLSRDAWPASWASFRLRQMDQEGR